MLTDFFRIALVGTVGIQMKDSDLKVHFGDYEPDTKTK